MKTAFVIAAVFSAFAVSVFWILWICAAVAEVREDINPDYKENRE